MLACGPHLPGPTDQSRTLPARTGVWRYMTERKARWPALVLFLVLVAATAAPGAADTSSELDATRDRLAVLQGELDRLAREHSDAQSRYARTEERIAQVRVRIDAVEARMGSIQDALAERAREAYVNGGLGTVELLLTSQNFAQFSDRVEFLGRVAQTEGDLVIEAEVAGEELRRDRDELAALLEQQAATVRELDAQREAIAQKLEEVRDLEAELERRLAAERAAAREAAERRAAAEAARRAAVAAAAASAASSSASTSSSSAASTSSGGSTAPATGGTFAVCPVGQPRTFSNDFGAPRSGGRSHQGNDIIAPLGTPVYAVQSGRFVQNYNSLGGISALVYGPNGDYTYYAHLSSYAGAPSGATVSAGTMIGHVGNTGNASGGITHLHFEYHPGGGGAVNPYHLLTQVC